MKRTEHGSRYRNDQAKNLVSFLVGAVRYAVEIQLVREIVNPLPMVPLPHAPPEVIGVADHRGNVLPIVDLRVRFGLGEGKVTRRTKWIIVRVPESEQVVALVVDAVTAVFGAGTAEQREVPELGRGRDLRGIATVYSHDGTLVFVVDPGVVTSAAQQLDPDTIPPLLGRSS
ncbi:MAG: Positive regulator of CheA protein [Myxococcaceae bacterium]|nr:Positive regulator of CheA protein [Myxococcaceae bacterium]